MKSRRAVFALLLAMLAAPARAAQPTAEDLGIVPLPRTIATSDGTYQTPQQWTIYGKSAAELEVAASAAAYFRKRGSTAYFVKDSAAALRFGVAADPALGREGYRLTVDGTGIAIDAPSEAGLYYGLQTLEQLVDVRGAVLPFVEITDTPRFARRGIVLDLTRRALPTPALQRFIDVASHYKLNTLELILPSHGGAAAAAMRQAQVLAAYARKYFVAVTSIVPRSRTTLLSFDADQGDGSGEPKASAGGVVRLQDVYAANAAATPGAAFEAQLSSENLANESQVFYALLPRAIALAEAAWSRPERRDWASFEQRMLPQYAWLERNGIAFRIPAPAFALAGAGTIEFPRAEASVQTVELHVQSPSVTVTMRSGMDDGEVHCTLDGSRPTATSRLYSAPLRLSVNEGAPTTLTCLSILRDGRESSPSTLILER